MKTAPSLKCLAAAAALLCAGVAAAQDLNSVITVERSVELVERDAVKLPLLPTLRLDSLSTRPLERSLKAVEARLAPLTGLLEPAPYVDPAYASMRRRGWLMAGAGAPTLNANLSAGYAIVDTERAGLEALVQYDTENYRREGRYERSHSALAGLRGRVATGRRSDLRGGVAYSWGHYTYGLPHAWATTNLAALDALWTNRCLEPDDWDAALGLRYHYFGFTGGGASENALDLTGRAGVALGSASRLGLDVTFSLATGDVTRTVTQLTPHWQWTGAHASLKAGPRIALNTGCGNKTLHVAPAVEAAWTPSRFFAAEASVTGGQSLPTLFALSRLTQRLDPAWTAPTVEDVPLDARLRLTVGPWRGVSLSLHGAWASAKRATMPTATAADVARFASREVRGCRLGADLSARWSRFVEFEARWDVAPRGDNPRDGWYEWIDGARNVLDLDLRVTPLRPLAVGVGWELRTGRRVVDYVQYVLGVLNATGTSADVTPLGRASDLRATVSYSFTRFDLWLRGSNLLGGRWLGADMAPVAGPAALVGITMRF